MDSPLGQKKSGSCKEVAVIGGLTVFWRLTLAWAYIFSYSCFFFGEGGLISRRLWYTDMYYMYMN